MAFRVPAILHVDRKVRHPLLGDTDMLVRQAVHNRHFHTDTGFQAFGKRMFVTDLCGMIDRHPVRTGKVDRGRHIAQVHERTVIVTRRKASCRHISIPQLEYLAASTAEVTGRIHHEIAQEIRMPDQLQEDRARSGVHLELVPYIRLSSAGNQCRVKVDIIGNTAKIIFGCQFHISSDTESKLAFPVCQQETGRFRFVETGTL